MTAESARLVYVAESQPDPFSMCSVPPVTERLCPVRSPTCRSTNSFFEPKFSLLGVHVTSPGGAVPAAARATAVAASTRPWP